VLGACRRAGGGEARDLEGGDALETRLAALVFNDDEGAAILVKHERHACLVALLSPLTTFPVVKFFRAFVDVLRFCYF
jgi:hypothetical protein